MPTYFRRIFARITYFSVQNSTPLSHRHMLQSRCHFFPSTHDAAFGRAVVVVVVFVDVVRKVGQVGVIGLVTMVGLVVGSARPGHVLLHRP